MPGLAAHFLQLQRRRRCRVSDHSPVAAFPSASPLLLPFIFKGTRDHMGPARVTPDSLPTESLPDSICNFKSSLPCSVTYSQAPGVGMRTCCGAVLLTHPSRRGLGNRTQPEAEASGRVSHPIRRPTPTRGPKSTRPTARPGTCPTPRPSVPIPVSSLGLGSVLTGQPGWRRCRLAALPRLV